MRVFSGLGFQSCSRGSRHRVVSVNCLASVEAPKGPRKRRVRRSKDPNSDDFKDSREASERLESIISDEDYPWRGPTEEDVMGTRPPRLLGSMLEAVTRCFFDTNPKADVVLDKIFSRRLPFSRVTVDLLEFRLLESKDSSNATIVDFFLDFGYELKSEYVLTDNPQPIYCKVLHPPPYRTLPKIIFSSLKFDEDLSEKVQEIIKKRMKDWMSLISKHGPVALCCCEIPWDLINSEELDLVFNESEFAAWCLVQGYTPSCLAMSVNEMQYSSNEVLASPIEVNIKDIKAFIQDEYLYFPHYRDQIKEYKDKSLDALIMLAEVTSVTLSDGVEWLVAGSSLVFTQRTVLDQNPNHSKEYGKLFEEHYDHTIDANLMSSIHSSVESSVIRNMKMEELHTEVLARAKQSGTDLTFDGSPEDKDNYEEQLEKVISSRAEREQN